MGRIAMRGCGGLAIVGLALLAAGCREESRGQYAVPMHEAYTRLATGNIQDFMENRQCGILIHNWIETDPDRSVTWHITSSNRQMLSFTATLIPVDARHTKVKVDISKEANGHEAYDGAQDYARPAVQQPVRPAIEEQVAALIEGRKFDDNRVISASVDRICGIQRAGLEGGMHFTIYDRPGMSADETISADYQETQRREFSSASQNDAHDSEFDKVARRYERDRTSRDDVRYPSRDSRAFARRREQGYGR